MTTLAKKLGIPRHCSLLLRKANGLGLPDTASLIGLAVARGCRHYEGGPEPIPASPLPREIFSDEELAIALLSPCLPYSPRAVRVGAQMLGSVGNRPWRLALLACQERAENVVRHIAVAGRSTEPEETFWEELLAALPPAVPHRSIVPNGVLPHPSRFRIETGFITQSRPIARGNSWMKWLRPSPVSAFPM